MANKRSKPEEIVLKLRQVEGLTGQGMAGLDAMRRIGGAPCRAIGPSDTGAQTNLVPLVCRRRKKRPQRSVFPPNKSGGMGGDPLKEWTRLQNWSRLNKRSGGLFVGRNVRRNVRRNNEWLRKAVSDLTLDKLILAEAAKDEGRQGNHPLDGLQA